jgi:hypothetical protein
VRVCVNSPSTMARATTKAVRKWVMKMHTYTFLTRRGDPTR